MPYTAAFWTNTLIHVCTEGKDPFGIRAFKHHPAPELKQLDFAGQRFYRLAPGDHSFTRIGKKVLEAENLLAQSMTLKRLKAGKKIATTVYRFPIRCPVQSEFGPGLRRSRQNKRPYDSSAGRKAKLSDSLGQSMYCPRKFDSTTLGRWTGAKLFLPRREESHASRGPWV